MSTCNTHQTSQSKNEQKQLLTVRFPDGHIDTLGSSWFINGDTAKVGDTIEPNLNVGIPSFNKELGFEKGLKLTVIKAVEWDNIDNCALRNKVLHVEAPNGDQYFFGSDWFKNADQAKPGDMVEPQIDPDLKESLKGKGLVDGVKYKVLTATDYIKQPERPAEPVEPLTWLTVRFPDGKQKVFDEGWFIDGYKAKPGDIVFPNLNIPANAGYGFQEGIGLTVLNVETSEQNEYNLLTENNATPSVLQIAARWRFRDYIGNFLKRFVGNSSNFDDNIIAKK